MPATPLYLKSSVAFEPLFNQWYAWWYLLAPASASMFVANLHLKLMQSFVTAPEVHVAALKSPELRGGPFINYGAERVEEVRALLARTSQEQADLVTFAKGVADLNALLASSPPGGSLEPLYEKVPPALRGFVELTYDLRNQPSFRLMESLLYRSPLYKKASQSLILRPLAGDDRPYVFSTPRLEEPATLHLPLAFADPLIDDLVRMREVPQVPEEMAERLKLNGEERARFFSLLTDKVPKPPAARYQGEGVRMRYFGHACVLLESQYASVLTDPIISYEFESPHPRFTLEDLPARVDYVLITHGHADHLAMETLLQLRGRVGTVVVPRSNGGSLNDPSLKLMLRAAGFPNVLELDELESVDFEGGSITGLPFLGEHCDLNVRAKMAHLVRMGGASLLMAADSNAIEPRLYDHIQDAVGPIDALFLGMECEGAPMSWTYGPLLTTPLPRKMDQARRSNGSNFSRAVLIVEKLKPQHVFVYAMGQEPWMGNLMIMGYTDQSPQILESNRLLAFCQERGIQAHRPFCQDERVISARTV